MKRKQRNGASPAEQRRPLRFTALTGRRIPTPEEIRRMYGPAATFGGEYAAHNAAHEAARSANDATMEMCGAYGLIQHALSMGQGLGLGAAFMGYAALASLKQNGLIAACVETVADDMTRAWMELVRSDGVVEDANANGADDTLEILNKDMAAFSLREVFHEAAAMCGYYGGCLIFIDTGIRDGLNMPLVASDVSGELKHGGLHAFRVIEPMHCTPVRVNTIDPLSPHFFKPEAWLIQGREVHASRFIHIKANEPPSLLRPSYNFFGIPKAQILYDYVLHFQECRVSAQRLLTKFSLTALKTDMDAVLNGGTAADIDRRIAYFVQRQSNDGIMLVDRETEDIIKLDTSLGGVTDIAKQALEFVTAINRTPAVKLMGISPSGFNATGESDLRNYYDHILSECEKIFRPGLQKALDVLQVSRFGKICPAVGFNFKPLSEEDKLVRATVRKTEAETAAVLIAKNVLHPSEVRKRLAADPDSGFGGIAPNGAPETSVTL